MIDSRVLVRCALVLASAVVHGNTFAQAEATTAADRAQKEADRPLYWIRLLADKPAAKPAPAPAPAVARAVARPAVATSEQRAPERLKVASAATVPAETGGPVVTPVSTRTAASYHAPATGELQAGVAAPAVAAGLAAPAMTPPALDIPAPEAEEPDPGLVMVSSVDPQFPMAAMRRLRQGEVEVRFEVGTSGEVDGVDVVKTSNSNLNNAALAAVRQWRFKPGPKAHAALVDLAFDLDK